eukprot:CFRG5602T1
MTKESTQRTDIVPLPSWASAVTSDPAWEPVGLQVNESNFLTGLLMRMPSRLENYDVYRKRNGVEGGIEGNKLCAFVSFGSAMCGHPDVVHGGAIAAVFDDLFGWLFGYQETKIFTAYLNTSYRSPTPIETHVVYEVWVEKVEGRKLFAKATARSGLSPDSTLFSESEALFIIARK